MTGVLKFYIEVILTIKKEGITPPRVVGLQGQPIPDLSYAVASSRVRENATILFAAKLDVFASVVCLSKQVSVMSLIPRQNQCIPVMEMRGVEPLSEM